MHKPDNGKAHASRESADEVIEEQRRVDDRIKNIEEASSDVQSDFFELHNRKMKDLRVRTLVLKKLNGGLTLSEEEELHLLKR